jgi:hypothetical protein
MLHMPKQAFASLLPFDEVAMSPLSLIERQVVYLSLADDRRSAIEETRTRRIWRAVFAQREANRLADPKLGALGYSASCAATTVTSSMTIRR